MILVISSGITLTKAEALRIQAEQVDHYTDHPQTHYGDGHMD